MTPEGACLLRRHPEGGDFRKAWETALKPGVQRLEDVAMERALNGVEMPVQHFGAVVGTRRVFNDRLPMFLLRNRSPKRFAADSTHRTDAATCASLARLKRQRRQEWEAEQEAGGAEVYAEIDAFLDRMIEQEDANKALMLEWEKEDAERDEGDE